MQQQQEVNNDVQIVRARIQEAHNQNELDLLTSPLAVPITCSFQAIGKPCQLVQGENSFYKCFSCRMIVCQRHKHQNAFREYLCHDLNKYLEHKKCVRCDTLYLPDSGHFQNCKGKKNVLEDFLNM